MSKLENDIFLDNIMDRIGEIAEYVTVGDLQTFQRLVSEGQLEEAEEFLTTLEDIHTDDLR